MAHRIKDTDGICCPCAEREGCNCGAPCTMIECRTRGGVATLVGDPEWCAPSLPPKRYLKSTPSYDESHAIYFGSTCSGSPTSTFTRFTTGQRIYNSLTGVLTDTVRLQGSDGLNVPFSPPAAVTLSDCPPLSDCDAVLNRSSTFWFLEWNGDCCFFSGNNRIVTGTGSWSLTDEDTEANAIARLLAGEGGEWGAWTTVGDGTGSTCVPTACCKSTWEPRGAGEFSFLYQEAQYRVTSTGNTPGWSVTMRLRFYRKLCGAPDEAYALHSQFTHVVTADIDGKAEATGDVPIQQGYDTYLQACARINT